MQRLNTVLIVAGAIVGLLAVAFGIGWATGQNDATRHVWHVVHLLIAFKALKWIAAGCLLAVLAIRRLLGFLRRP